MLNHKVVLLLRLEVQFCWVIPATYLVARCSLLWTLVPLWSDINGWYYLRRPLSLIVSILLVGMNLPFWCKPPRKVSYKCTFGVPDQGQTLDVWESQTTESALRWRTRQIAPRHTPEVVLEVILEHLLRIKTMTSSILDHVAIAYLYLGINTGEKVMILFVVIALELSQDWSWSIKHAPQSFFL